MFVRQCITISRQAHVIHTNEYRAALASCSGHWTRVQMALCFDLRSSLKATRSIFLQPVKHQRYQNRQHQLYASMNRFVYAPLYESLGLVRHMTRWHSMSSGSTNLLHTGHLIPAHKQNNVVSIQHRLGLVEISSFSDGLKYSCELTSKRRYVKL